MKKILLNVILCGLCLQLLTQCKEGKFYGNDVIQLTNLNAGNDILTYNENAEEVIAYLENGIEFPPYVAQKKMDKGLLAEKSIRLVSLKNHQQLAEGESMCVLVHYKYPQVPTDRLRWARFKVGDYEVSIQKSINLIDQTKPKATFDEYLVPFAMMGRQNEDIWMIITHEKKSLKLTLMKKDNPEYAVTCSWEVREMNKPKAAFGMYNYIINGLTHHDGPSHLFKAVSVGNVDFDQLPEQKTIPKNEVRPYMLKNLKRNRRGYKGKKIAFEGPVKKSELQSFKDYYVDEMGLPNYDRNFGNFTSPCVGHWLYGKLNDIAILDKTIEACESAYRARNDIDPKLRVALIHGTTLAKGHVIDKLLPTWPQYNVKWFDDQDKIGLGNAAAQSAGVVWPAACARMIAEHKDIWNKKYTGVVKRLQGKTYLDIAKELLKQSKDVFDFYIAEYLEHPERENVMAPFVPTDKQIYVTCSVFAGEKIGVHPYFNRILPLMLAKLQAVKAYETIGIEREYSKRLDQIVKDNLEYIYSYMFVVERNGKQVLTHPYSASDFPSPELRPEDRGHGSMDGRVFMFFYHEGYFPEKYVKYYANSLLNMYQGDGKYSLYIDGSEPNISSKVYGAGEGYFYLAKFRPEIIDCLWKTHYTGKPVQVYAIMRTREDLFGR
ncbi:hypothetical protein EYV94_20440 [Puteibacter caeruleilacunae]|nr:hypothetical protein EYV94_20440 [Puteibacter caeruleilacunae]